MAQKRQKKAFEQAKGKKIKSFLFKDGDEVMKANMRKQGRKGGKLEGNWSGPYVISSLSSKGGESYGAGHPLGPDLLCARQVHGGQCPPYSRCFGRLQLIGF